jgi:membrane-bound serine protease (ClpP class)
MWLVRFALDPAVSGILLGLGFAGLLMEMLTLSLGAGLAGAAAFALFFAAHLSGVPNDTLTIALAVTGLVAILVEFHVLPGHGVAGSFGLLALVAAIVLAFGVPWFVVAGQSLAVAVVVCVIAFVIARRVVPDKVFVNRLSLRDPEGAPGVASPDYRALIGAAGFAVSFLRPAGVAAIGGQRVDVLTEGDFVPAGAAVVVTRVEGARVYVRPEGTP